MDREGIKKHRAVFDAWLDGAKIQCRSEGGDFWWPTDDPPAWDYDTEYRVKPEPETREMWANVYPENIVLSRTQTYANTVAGTHRIACIPVTITFAPGEGLDGGDS